MYKITSATISIYPTQVKQNNIFSIFSTPVTTLTNSVSAGDIVHIRLPQGVLTIFIYEIVEDSQAVNLTGPVTWTGTKEELNNLPEGVDMIHTRPVQITESNIHSYIMMLEFRLLTLEVEERQKPDDI